MVATQSPQQATGAAARREESPVARSTGASTAPAPWIDGAPSDALADTLARAVRLRGGGSLAREVGADAGDETPRDKAMQLLAVDRAGPWKQLSWRAVSDSAMARVDNPTLIDQEPLQVCGSAAVLEAIAGHDPVRYAKLVVDLFTTGRAAGHDTNEILRGRKPPRLMDPCDWMVLSSMQHIVNPVLAYYGGVGDWNKRDGTFPWDDGWALRHFGGCVKVKTYYCMTRGVKEQTQRVNALMRAYTDDITVLMGVQEANLIGAKGPVPSDVGWHPSANHVIRLVEPVDWQPDRVRLKIYSWGAITQLDMTPANFRRFTWFYTVGAWSENVKL